MKTEINAVLHIPMYREDENTYRGYPTGFRLFAIKVASFVRIVFYPMLLFFLYLVFDDQVSPYFEFVNRYVHEHVLLALFIGGIPCVVVLLGMKFTPFPEYGEITCYDDGSIRLARSSKQELLDRDLSRLPYDKVIHDKNDSHESYFLLLSKKNIKSVSLVIKGNPLKKGASLFGESSSSPFVGGVMVVAIELERLYVHRNSLWRRFSTIGDTLVSDTLVYTSVDSTESFNSLRSLVSE